MIADDASTRLIVSTATATMVSEPPGAAVSLGHFDAHEPELEELRDQLGVELRGAVHRHRARTHLRLGELGDGVAERVLVVGEAGERVAGGLGHAPNVLRVNPLRESPRSPVRPARRAPRPAPPARRRARARASRARSPMPSAAACSLDFSFARRMRATISSGTTTPGTSFARNSALRAETSGQMPATTGMRACAIEPRKRSSCAGSNTGCVIANSAPASTF